MDDDLERWLTARPAMRSHPAQMAPCAPARGIRDGHEHFIATVIEPRDQQKALHWRAALAHCRLEASRGERLTWQRLAGWNALVRGFPVGADTPEPRRTVAYAKDGRERYGIPPDFLDRFQLALADSDDQRLAVATRATLAYLDVAFFHPFADGNARCAALALDFVLAREGIILDQLAPVLVVPRWADDPLVGMQLVDLLGVLLSATQARSRAEPVIQPT